MPTDPNLIPVDNPILGMIDAAAEHYGVDRNLAHAVAQMESNYNPKADSGKAQGVMQLAPATAKSYGVTDRFDPAQNIDGGVRFLRDLSQKYDGNNRLVLAAYNAGEPAVDRAGGVPSFPETTNYVEKGTRLLASASPSDLSADPNLAPVGSAPAAPQTRPQPFVEVLPPLSEPPGGKPSPPEKTVRGFLDNVTTGLGRIIEPLTDPAGTLENVTNLIQGMSEKSGFAPVMGQPKQQVVDAIVNLYKHRYGSLEGFKNAWYDDPVGMAGDVAMVFSGAGLGAKAAQEFLKASGVAEHAATIADTLPKAAAGAAETRVQAGIRGAVDALGKRYSEVVQAGMEKAPSGVLGGPHGMLSTAKYGAAKKAGQILKEGWQAATTAYDAPGAASAEEAAAAATPAAAPAVAKTPGQMYAESQGHDWAKLSANDRALMEHIGQAQANVAAQTPPVSAAPTATPTPQPEPPTTPPAAPQTAPAAAPSTTGLTEAGKDMGAAITDNMYGALWEKVLAGDITEGGQPSALLQAARIVRDHGGLQTPEAFRAFATDYMQVVPRGPGFQAGMRYLVNKHLPVEPPITSPAAPQAAPAAPEAPAATQEPAVGLSAPEAPQTLQPAAAVEKLTDLMLEKRVSPHVIERFEPQHWQFFADEAGVPVPTPDEIAQIKANVAAKEVRTTPQGERVFQEQKARAEESMTPGKTPPSAAPPAGGVVMEPLPEHIPAHYLEHYTRQGLTVTERDFAKDLRIADYVLGKGISPEEFAAKSLEEQNKLIQEAPTASGKGKHYAYLENPGPGKGRPAAAGIRHIADTMRWRQAQTPAAPAGLEPAELRNPAKGVYEEGERLSAMPPETPIWVFHATRSKGILDAWVEHGIKASEKPANLAMLRYESGEGAEFAPGRGLSRGVYVAGSVNDATGYGPHVVAIKTRIGDLQVPPEQQMLGVKNGAHALATNDGAVLTGDIKPEDIVSFGRVNTRIGIDELKQRLGLVQETEPSAAAPEAATMPVEAGPARHESWEPDYIEQQNAKLRERQLQAWDEMAVEKVKDARLQGRQYGEWSAESAQRHSSSQTAADYNAELEQDFQAFTHPRQLTSHWDKYTPERQAEIRTAFTEAYNAAKPPPAHPAAIPTEGIETPAQAKAAFEAEQAKPAPAKRTRRAKPKS